MLRRLSKERVPATGELLFDNLKVCNSRTVSPASGEMLAGASAPARDAVLMRVRGKNGSFVRRFRPACSRSFATARKAGACRLVWKWLQKGTLRDLPIAASLKCQGGDVELDGALALRDLPTVASLKQPPTQVTPTVPLECVKGWRLLSVTGKSRSSGIRRGACSARDFPFSLSRGCHR